MKAYICDKCDKILPIDGDKITLSVNLKYDEQFHLCQECYLKLQGWLFAREEDEHERVYSHH